MKTSVFSIGQKVTSSFHGVTGVITKVKLNGFMGYTEITVAYKILAMGSSDDYRDKEETFVVSQTSEWVNTPNK